MYNTSNQIPYSIAMTPVSENRNTGFNGDCSWLIIILLFFMFYGAGDGNGFFGNGRNSGVSENYTLASDFATVQRQIDSSTASLERKLDGIDSGLCDGFYAQAQLINNTNQNISQNGYETRNAIQQNSIANMQNTNALQTQIAQACCQNKESIMNTNYNMTTQTNAIQTAIANGFCQSNYNAATNTRDIVDSQNNGTQAILAKLAQMESSAKDNKIAELTAMNADLRLRASQADQNQYLVNTLRPLPQPSYMVANPYCSCGYTGLAYSTGTTVV